MPPKKLTINIDDVGVHSAVNDALERLSGLGRVDSCSIIAGGRAAEEAMALVRRSPSIEAGCHLTLVEEKSIAPPETIRTLIDPKTGCFHVNYRRFVARMVAGRISIAELELEMGAQIERMLRAGIRIAHLDSHQHVHVLQPVLSVVIKLARRYGIRRIRIPVDPWRALIDHFGWRAVAALGLNVVSRKALVAVLEAGIEPKISVGVVRSGSMNLARVRRYMGYLKGAESDRELIMHPNADEASFNACYAHWGFKGEREMEALSDPRLDDVIRLGGFERAHAAFN